MSGNDLIQFAASQSGDVVTVVSQTQISHLDDNPVKDALGQGVKSVDLNHAVLVIREAPRLGADVTKDQTLRAHLEAKEVVTRPPTGKIVFATDDFLLEGMSEPDNERYSVVYNFGNPAVQTSSPSGRRHRLFSYQGSLLINAIEGSSSSRFIAAWEKYLRGSVGVNGDARRDIPYVAELTYRDQVRRGYMTALTRNRSSAYETHMSFSMEMFVIHQSNIGLQPSDVGRKVSQFRADVADRSFIGPRLPSEPLNIADLGIFE